MTFTHQAFNTMRSLTLIFASAILILSSCTSGWDGEAQDLFLQACHEEAANLNADDDQKENYCECRLEKAMKKYPKLSDALAHQDSLIMDEEMQKCTEELSR